MKIRVEMEVHCDGISCPIKVNIHEIGSSPSILAAVSTGLVFGLSLEQIKHSLAKHKA